MQGHDSEIKWWDLGKCFGEITIAKELQSIEVPIKYKDLEDDMHKYRMENRPILDPHAVISFLFEHGKLKIPEAQVRKYWEHNLELGVEWARTVVNHQMVPLGLFGDGATVTTQFGLHSVVGIFLSIVLFRPKSICASRFLLFSIAEDEVWSHHTMDKVLRRITWSLNALYDGHHPCTDAYGRSLSGSLQSLAGKPICSSGLRFATTELRGDWSWHKKIWRFKNTSWTGKQVCHWCGALAEGDWPDLYWNLSSTSSWNNQNFSLDEFMEERIPDFGI